MVNRWKEILVKHGLKHVWDDIWYVMFSSKPRPYSVKKYLNRNVWLTRTMIGSLIPKFKGARDNVIFKVFDFVTLNVNYVKDSKKFGEVEHWEDVDNIMITRQADCESMCTLMFSILRTHGYSVGQLRFVCGEVMLNGKLTGHAWLEYMADEDMNWYIFDPAYKPDNNTMFGYRKTVAEDKDYVERWFSVTDLDLI